MAVRIENNDIFIRKFKSREGFFIKIMNDCFQNAILSFVALSRTGKSARLTLKTRFYHYIVIRVWLLL